jgi:hypothetical protein
LHITEGHKSDKKSRSERLSAGFLAVGELAKSAAQGSTTAKDALKILEQTQLADIAALEAQLKLLNAQNVLHGVSRFMPLPDSSKKSP